MPARETLLDALEARGRRRNERRDFFKSAVGAVAVGVGALSFTRVAEAQTAPTDADILNFALNLEYLEAQFYAYAATGMGLPADQLTGTQTQGMVTGARKANLTDPQVIQYVREIAADEAAHVASLRRALTTAAVAQPAIDLSPTVFNAAALAAEIDLGASGGVFDPYANDDNFLLAAYIFEDVGVTAYKGASPLLSDVDLIDAAAGLLDAVWHGLMHKEEKGQLEIDVLSENEFIYIKILDNGIGRQKAATLHNKVAADHKSMGLGITSQRIAMVQEPNIHGPMVVINDLVDTTGAPCGTEVILKLPILYD